MYLGYLKFKSPYNGGKEKRKRMKSVSYLMENKTGTQMRYKCFIFGTAKIGGENMNGRKPIQNSLFFVL